MGTNVGGDPDTISAGAAALNTAATSVGHVSTGIDQAGRRGSSGAAVDPLAGAISRFAAAFSQTIGDVRTEIQAASQLADSAAADLQTAGGGPR